jgi:hypothetical protein
MTDFDPAALERAVTDDSIDTELDERDVRALTQYLTVLDDVDLARDAEDLYAVVSESGKQYLVDAREGSCTCPDATHRDPDGGCKHVRRVAFVTGEREIPAWVDRDDLDDQFGAHVDAEPRQAATDGGEIVVAGDEGEVLEEADDVDERPADCDCVDWNSDVGLPCFECYYAGFETPNPDLEGDDA